MRGMRELKQSKYYIVGIVLLFPLLFVSSIMIAGILDPEAELNNILFITMIFLSSIQIVLLIAILIRLDDSKKQHR